MGDESVWEEVMPVPTSFSHRLEPAAPHHGSRVPHSPDSSEDVQWTSCPRTSSLEAGDGPCMRAAGPASWSAHQLSSTRLNGVGPGIPLPKTAPLSHLHSLPWSSAFRRFLQGRWAWKHWVPPASSLQTDGGAVHQQSTAPPSVWQTGRQRSSHLECRSLCPLHASQYMHAQSQPPCDCALSRNI